MKTDIFPINVQNKNNRSYSKDSFKDLTGQFMIRIPSTPLKASIEINLADCVGKAENLQYSENFLIGDVEFINSAKEYEKLFFEKEMVLVPISIANVDDGIVKNATLKGFDLIYKNLDSFER